MRLIASVLLQASFLLLINQNGVQGQRLAVQKCAEYAKMKTHSLEPSANNPQPNQCGMTIDGSVDQREFPHYVVIEDPTQSCEFCAGALISEQYVLTTTSCVSKLLVKSVRLGSVTNLRETKGVVRREIETFLRHPINRLAQAYHDIGIIRLNESVQFSDTIRPICLSDDLTSKGELILHGFGNEYSTGNVAPQMTKIVQPPLMARSACQDVLSLHPTRRLKDGLAKEQFCIDSSDEAACATSVADLLVKKDNESCSYFLEGIGSIGFSCGVANSVAIYTNVTQYLDWIEGIVWTGA